MPARDHRRLNRREALGVFSAALATASCSGGTPTSPSATTASTTTAATTTTTTTPSTSTGACTVTPTETEGPYPSKALPTRADVREDRQGLPLTLAITVVNTNQACAPVTNATVEIWHCDAAGNYSEYGALTSATWLRGVLGVDANGTATFTTIYPGWYSGRATHIHVEVAVAGRSVKVTQMAFPEDVSNAVHVTGAYASKGVNPTKNGSDGIFADGYSSELAALSGSPSSGYTATFTVGVAL